MKVLVKYGVHTSLSLVWGSNSWGSRLHLRRNNLHQMPDRRLPHFTHRESIDKTWVYRMRSVIGSIGRHAPWMKVSCPKWSHLETWFSWVRIQIKWRHIQGSPKPGIPDEPGLICGLAEARTVLRAAMKCAVLSIRLRALSLSVLGVGMKKTSPISSNMRLCRGAPQNACSCRLIFEHSQAKVVLNVVISVRGVPLHHNWGYWG